MSLRRRRRCSERSTARIAHGAGPSFRSTWIALARRFPDLQVNGNAIYIKDGKFYTSGGATAGIDLALSLIEEDYGQQVSLTVDRQLVVYLKRSGGQ